MPSRAGISGSGRGSLGKSVAVTLGVWLVVALALGGAGLWLALPAPATGAALWLAVGALLWASWRSAPLREWLLDGIDARALVLLHVSRLVGIDFIRLFRAKELPFAFGVPGAYGDILAAVGALVVAALFLPLRRGWRSWGLALWNVYGLADLLLVVGTALRFFLGAPQQVEPLRRLPLCLLPTFLVPLLLFTHLVLFARLRAIARRPPRPPNSAP